MKTRQSLSFLLLILLFSSCSKKPRNNYSIELIKIANNDTIFFDSINLKNIHQIDLDLLVKKINYPPKLPTQFLWQLPDTTTMNQIEKNEVFYYYRFDKYGRVTLYHYLGSFISGIFPKTYLFYYDSVKTNLILEINDFDGGSFKKYKMIYDQSDNINLIEQFNFDGVKTEVLIIKQK